MIEKLPETYEVRDELDPVIMERNLKGEYPLFLYDKIQELIDKVNALEKAVKQCDRPVDLEV